MRATAASQPMQIGNRAAGFRARLAFTLIEIMVVVGILGVILTMGAPPFLKMLQKEGMRKAVSDVRDVCSNARALAIFRGTPTEVVFHPLERQFEVGNGGSAAAPQSPTTGGIAVENPPTPAKPGLAGKLPDGIDIEMLDINFLEYNQSEVARVRFFPNGTSDELTLILRSRKNEWCKISLEGVTALTSVENIR